MATSVSAAKRYRLRCLKAVILALARPGSAPAVELGDDESDAMSPEDKAKQVGSGHSSMSPALAWLGVAGRASAGGKIYLT